MRLGRRSLVVLALLSLIGVGPGPLQAQRTSGDWSLALRTVYAVEHDARHQVADLGNGGSLFFGDLPNAPAVALSVGRALGGLPLRVELEGSYRFGRTATAQWGCTPQGDEPVACPDILLLTDGRVSGLGASASVVGGWQTPLEPVRLSLRLGTGVQHWRWSWDDFEQPFSGPVSRTESTRTMPTVHFGLGALYRADRFRAGAEVRPVYAFDDGDTSRWIELGLTLGYRVR